MGDNLLSSIQQHTSELQSLLSSAEATNFRTTSGKEVRGKLKALVLQINSEAKELFKVPASDQSISKLQLLNKSFVTLNAKVGALDEEIRKNGKEELIPNVQIGTKEGEREAKALLTKSTNGTFAIIPEDSERCTFRLIYKKATGEIKNKQLQVTSEGKLHVGKTNFTSFETLSQRYRLTKTVIESAREPKESTEIAGRIYELTSYTGPIQEDDPEKYIKQLGTLALNYGNTMVGACMVHGQGSDLALLYLDKNLRVQSVHIKVHADAFVTSDKSYANMAELQADLGIKSFDEIKAHIRAKDLEGQSVKFAILDLNRRITHEPIQSGASAVRMLNHAIRQLGMQTEGAHLVFEESGKLFLAYISNQKVEKAEIDLLEFAQLPRYEIETKLLQLVPHLTHSTSWAMDTKKVQDTRTAILQGSAPTGEDYKSHPTELQSHLAALQQASVGGFAIYPGANDHTLSCDVIVEGPTVRQFQLDLASVPGKIKIGEKIFDNVPDAIAEVGGKLSINQLRKLNESALGTARNVLQHQNYDYHVQNANAAAAKLAGMITASGAKSGWLIHASPQAKSTGYLAGALSWVTPKAVKYYSELYGLKEARAQYVLSVLVKGSDGKNVLTEHEVSIDATNQQFRYKEQAYRTLDEVASFIGKEMSASKLPSLIDLERQMKAVDACKAALMHDASCHGSKSWKQNKLPNFETLDTVDERLFRWKNELDRAYLIYPRSHSRQVACLVNGKEEQCTVNEDLFTLSFVDSGERRHHYQIDLTSSPGKYCLIDEKEQKLGPFNTILELVEAAGDNLEPFAKRWEEMHAPPLPMAKSIFTSKSQTIKTQPQPVIPVEEESTLAKMMDKLSLQKRSPGFTVHLQKADLMMFDPPKPAAEMAKEVKEESVSPLAPLPKKKEVKKEGPIEA